ncbi:MAG: sulfatase [Planctomycetota bacterium]|nr:sulfatase [Planctomycetota bacterium]
MLSRARSLLAPPLAVCTLLTGCGGDVEAGDSRPDLVVVCIDTLRADHTSLHGYDRPTTPALEAIAAEGVSFTRHLCNASWTKPSMGTLWTGLAPSAHGARLGQFLHRPQPGSAPTVEVLAAEHHTLAEALAEEGYFTCAHVTNYNLTARWGFDQGFDEYVFLEDATAIDVVGDADQSAVEYALEQLEAQSAPVFAWLHLMAVHQYAAPAAARAFTAPRTSDGGTPIDREALSARRLEDFETLEAAVAAYDNSILATDRRLADLWSRLRRDHPGALLIVTSDHGEEFYEHGGFEHGSTLYAEQLHVPLVIAGAGIEARRVEHLTDAVDLYPTLLALAGASPAAYDGPGQALLAGVPSSQRSFAELHARGAWRRYAVVDDGEKLIWSTRKGDGAVEVEYFSDAFGPEAVSEYAGADPARLRELAQALEDYRTRCESDLARRVGAGRTMPVSEAELAGLEGLGYAGGEHGESAGD